VGGPAGPLAGDVTAWIDTITIVEEEIYSEDRLRACFHSACLAALALAGLARADYTNDIGGLIRKAEPWPAEVALEPSAPADRDRYLATARVHFESIRSMAVYWLQQAKPYPTWASTSATRPGSRPCIAPWAGRISPPTPAGASSTPSVCSMTLRRTEREAGWDQVRDLYWVDRWLTAAPPTPTRTGGRCATSLARPAVVPAQVEYGAFNRPFGAALCGESLLALAPDAAGCRPLRTYIEEVWNGCGGSGTPREHGPLQRPLVSLPADWAAIRGAENTLWSDPASAT